MTRPNPDISAIVQRPTDPLNWILAEAERRAIDDDIRQWLAALRAPSPAPGLERCAMPERRANYDPTQQRCEVATARLGPEGRINDRNSNKAGNMPRRGHNQQEAISCYSRTVYQASSQPLPPAPRLREGAAHDCHQRHAA